MVKSNLPISHHMDKILTNKMYEIKLLMACLNLIYSFHNLQIRFKQKCWMNTFGNHDRLELFLCIFFHAINKLN